MIEKDEIHAFRIRVAWFDSFFLMSTLEQHLGKEYTDDLMDIGSIGSVSSLGIEGELKIEAQGLCRFPACGLIFEEIRREVHDVDALELELQPFLTIENGGAGMFP